MASFSNSTKSEICAGIKSDDDRRAFLTGVLLAARDYTPETLCLSTGCDAFAALIPKLLSAAGADLIRMQTSYRKCGAAPPAWNVVLNDLDAVAAIGRNLGISPVRRADAPAKAHGRNRLLLAAGAFVVCGSVTDPERGYHLEMAVPDALAGLALKEMLADLETPILMKTTERNHELLLYLKQNEQICDTLVSFGAQNAALALIEQQVFRDLKNQTVRRMNCDLANIDKAVAAGNTQVAAIRKIQETVGLDSLPDHLRAIAALRLAEPETSLRDLGAMLEPPISRSGVHHRLQKLLEMAEKL